MDPIDLSFERARCERVNAVLHRYGGGYAELWEYSVSLGKLTIRVGLDGLQKNCHLTCMDCRYISCPGAWESARLELQFDESRREYMLVDADVQISCGLVEIHENGEPHFLITPASSVSS